jgi:hypothetical protein
MIWNSSSTATWRSWVKTSVNTYDFSWKIMLCDFSNLNVDFYHVNVWIRNDWSCRKSNSVTGNVLIEKQSHNCSLSFRKIRAWWNCGRMNCFWFTCCKCSNFKNNLTREKDCFNFRGSYMNKSSIIYKRQNFYILCE